MSKYIDFLINNEIMGLLIQLELVGVCKKGGILSVIE